MLLFLFGCVAFYSWAILWKKLCNNFQLTLRKGRELLTAEEEGGKTSSQYFIKYVSRLIMLKMYRKCTYAPFTPFLMIEKLKPCLA